MQPELRRPPVGSNPTENQRDVENQKKPWAGSSLEANSCHQSAARQVMRLVNKIYYEK